MSRSSARRVKSIVVVFNGAVEKLDRNVRTQYGALKTSALPLPPQFDCLIDLAFQPRSVGLPAGDFD